MVRIRAARWRQKQALQTAAAAVLHLCDDLPQQAGEPAAAEKEDDRSWVTGGEACASEEASSK